MSRVNEEPIAVDEIQGDILEGLPKRAECLIFFEIEDVARFRDFLKTLDVTNLATVLAWRKLIAARKQQGIETLVPTPGLNLAFTSRGMKRLGVNGIDGNDKLVEFSGGMQGSRETLGDPQAIAWTILKKAAVVHGVFIVTGASDAEIADTISLRLSPAALQGWRMTDRQVGKVRPDPVKGHEHFGYADGVSQPGVRGFVGNTGKFLTTNDDPANTDQGQRGQDLLWTGEFVFGYHGQDFNAANLTVRGDVKLPPIPMMKNGSFLVVRRLAQSVPEFNAAVNALSKSIPPGSEQSPPDRLGAQMIGRWKSGAPLVNSRFANSGLVDNPTFADGTDFVNDFEFKQDPDGIKCPFAAHVRKVYPRDDIFDEKDPDKAEAHTQTHRMLRRGIAYGPEVSLDEASAGVTDAKVSRGLLFMCYVTSIADQFEFVQKNWVNNFDFTKNASGFDPIISQVAIAEKPFLGGCPVSGSVAQKPQLLFPSFVHMQGGDYFFSPSLSAIKSL